MTYYKQLTIEEREVIQEMHWRKESIRAIARQLSRPPSTVSRELKRNYPAKIKTYSPRKAHERATAKRSSRGREIGLKNRVIREYVIAGLHNGLSPEQIAGRLPLECLGEHISHEAIYQFIYAQFRRGGYGNCIGIDLRPYLKRRHKTRVIKDGRKCKKVHRINGFSIDERPPEIEKRLSVGSWEIDLVVSRHSKSCLQTIVERKTGLVRIAKLPCATAEAAFQGIQKSIGNLPSELVETITSDNGSENACHKEVMQSLQLTWYFAHPYSSWERGTNENTNGLIRWYFPKGTDFATITNEQVKAVEDALNNRPRKRLGYLTPSEVFNKSVALHS